MSLRRNLRAAHVVSTWPRSTTRPIRGRGASEPSACAKARSARCCAATPGCSKAASPRAGPTAGETVRVEAHDGRFLAWGAYRRLRPSACAPGASTSPSASTLPSSRAARSAPWRCARGWQWTATRLRLVHGEADGLPGLVVDRYGDTLVAQFGFVGTERWKDTIADALLAATGCTRLYERSDLACASSKACPSSGLAARRRRRDRGSPLREHGWQSHGRRGPGHKTGSFYLDQRDNRLHFAQAVRALRLRPGAQLLQLHRRLHGGGAGRRRAASHQRRHVGAGAGAGAAPCAAQRLRRRRARGGGCRCQRPPAPALEQGRRFDAIVLDPPKFAPTAAQVERAARAYKDINRLALKLLRAGRAAVHLLLLRRHWPGAVPQDRRRRGDRRRRRCRDRPAPACRARPSEHAVLPRGRVPEGAGAAAARRLSFSRDRARGCPSASCGGTPSCAPRPAGGPPR